MGQGGEVYFKRITLQDSKLVDWRKPLAKCRREVAVKLNGCYVGPGLYQQLRKCTLPGPDLDDVIIRCDFKCINDALADAAVTKEILAEGPLWPVLHFRIADIR